MNLDGLKTRHASERLAINLKLIGFHDQLNDEGEFVAWSVLFIDVDRGRRMVAIVDGGALSSRRLFRIVKRSVILDTGAALQWLAHWQTPRIVSTC